MKLTFNLPPIPLFFLHPYPYSPFPHILNNRCSRGYYGFPLCQPCDCNYNGTRDEVCQVGGGQCPCKPNYTGLDCDQCAPGFYNFPECKCKLIGGTGV